MIIIEGAWKYAMDIVFVVCVIKIKAYTNICGLYDWDLRSLGWGLLRGNCGGE